LPFFSILKSSPNFKRNGAHLVENKTLKKNNDYLFLRFECFEFVSSFEHINLAIDGKYSEIFNDNPNYYASFFIFQTYKNIVLRSVHSLGWLL